MGNTDSQNSTPVTGVSSFMLAKKPKTCAMKIRSTKQEVLSPRSWWRGKEGGMAYKCRTPGRSNQRCGSRRYECYSKWGRAGGSPLHLSEQGVQMPLDNSCLGTFYSDCEKAETRPSPRILVREDGSLQVEFTDRIADELIPSRSSEPVQLLKFSPTFQFTTTATKDPTSRTSKGSSLSSDESWYDSPWGFGGEVSDAEKSCSSGNAGDSYTRDSGGSAGNNYSITRDNTCSSGLSGDNHSRDHGYSSGFTLDNCSNKSLCFTDLAGDPLPTVKGGHSEFIQVCMTEDNRSSSGLSENCSLKDSLTLQTNQMAIDQCLSPSSFTFYRVHDTSGTFPRVSESPTDLLHVPHGSLASVVDEGEVVAEFPDYTSYTLPCRKTVKDVDCNSKKNLLKSRMRRLSDWTGSLNRKRRKLQQPHNNSSEFVDSGVDMQTVESSSPSQTSTLSCYPALPFTASAMALSHINTLPACHTQDPGDAFRRNVYENFMRELETVHGSAEPEHIVETEETGSDSLNSLEQLDLLFEKEQGVVRKAGWLCFKPLVTLCKDRKLELVPRRKWKQYWVTLKGCTLLFYETFGKSSTEQDSSPRYALLAEDSIVQAVPEHPKKENVFCLSNTYGDVYLFQASSQTDLENWVTAIHSASSSLLAKRHGKEDTVRLLRSQTRSLLQKIDMDGKMRKMAELQLAVVNDQRNRRAIENQIQQWEQNLEKFNMDLFRLRCYLASLEGGELPNPKILLAAASRPSKAALSRLGIFSVSSFHALVCSRDEATLRRRSRSLSRAIQGKRGFLSSFKGLDTLARRGRNKKQLVAQVFESPPGGQLGHFPPCSSEKIDIPAHPYPTMPSEDGLWHSDLETVTCVYLPGNHAVNVTIRRGHTVEDVLVAACKVKNLEPSQHCLCVCNGTGSGGEFIIPPSSDRIQELVFDKLEVFPLGIYPLLITRPDNDADFGFAVTGHVDGYRKSHVFVSEVRPGGVAFVEGLRSGDEILVLNGRCVATLDLGLIQSLFTQQTISLLLRRDVAPEVRNSVSLDEQHKENALPAPPSSPPIVPKEPCRDMYRVPDAPCSREGEPLHSKLENWVERGIKGVDGSTNSLMVDHRDSQILVLQTPSSRHMSTKERLCMVIQELVDTEKSYVKDLTCLFEIYLKPLQNQTFLSLDEMDSLFGSLPEMLDFQKVFLQTLQDHVSSSPDVSSQEASVHFKKLLSSLGGAFLCYADHFKLYSGFCANHIKVQKVLERAKTDRAFKNFLDAKNPTKQHSSTLESYLIKPVQRVLKYPLLLRKLVSLTDSESEEHLHLTEALKAMEKVASHINEMQKIYEDYGTVFDQLVMEQSSTEKEITEISMGEFLAHSFVKWLNPFPSLGRMRKNPELNVFVFKKAVILVYQESNKGKRKTGTTRTPYSHGDVVPFKFRWLIPLSALQVRLGSNSGGEPEGVWELIHTKSELEGRPETTFQLCSRTLDCKASMVKVIRSLVRESIRRNVPPAEKACRERLGSLQSNGPVSCRTGTSQAPVLKHRDPFPAEPVCINALKEDRTGCDEATGALEDQLQRLWIKEVPMEGVELNTLKAEQDGSQDDTFT